jgi:hypothetical protein
MHFFLKSIDCWKTIETSWTEPADTILSLQTKETHDFPNDKALHALCQALSLSEFTKISN